MLGRKLFKFVFVVPLVLLWAVPFFIAGAGLGAYVVFSSDLPEIPGLATYQPRTVSTFFSDDGTVIGIFYKQKRFVVDLAQMPTHVIDAFLAAEDARFYEHKGVDWLGISRAMVRNLKAGRIVQGGSTITMQVTRNFLLTRERSFSRKIREIILAQRLEKVWGKEKVLHIYLNEIYLGEGNYGVEAASRGYFDKPVEHLNLAEAALIAGLVASPARFNPFKSEELARHRQLTVLGRMLKGGFIVLCDRYIYAPHAIDRVRGCDAAWLQGLYQFAIPADLVFYLDLPIHLTMERLHDARIEPSYFDAGMDLKLSQDLFESYRLFQGRLLNEYLAMANEYGFHVIDATLKISEQQRIIRQKIQKVIDLKKLKEGRC